MLYPSIVLASGEMGVVLRARLVKKNKRDFLVAKISWSPDAIAAHAVKDKELQFTDPDWNTGWQQREFPADRVEQLGWDPLAKVWLVRVDWQNADRELASTAEISQWKAEVESLKKALDRQRHLTTSFEKDLDMLLDNRIEWETRMSPLLSKMREIKELLEIVTRDRGART
jgi:hypothetical protein